MKTEREFLTYVVENETNAEVKAYAMERLEKLNERNEKASAKRESEKAERLECLNEVITWAIATNSVLTSSTVAEHLSELSGETTTTSKASALLRFGVKEGLLVDAGYEIATILNAAGKSVKSKKKVYEVAR